MSESTQPKSPEKAEAAAQLFDAKKNQQKKEDFNARYGSDFVSNPTLTEEPEN